MPAPARAAVRIAIVGAGAMGSVYAGLLGSAGNDVWAIDPWAAHVDAIRAARAARRGCERRPCGADRRHVAIPARSAPSTSS